MVWEEQQVREWRQEQDIFAGSVEGAQSEGDYPLGTHHLMLPSPLLGNSRFYPFSASFHNPTMNDESKNLMSNPHIKTNFLIKMEG